MDRSRYQDLYAAEAADHLARLGHALLALEGGDAAAATEEAFRAVHTLKGMAATMGFADVAERAHRLEGTLESVRGGVGPRDQSVVDHLLSLADGLEAAVHASLAEGPLVSEPASRSPERDTVGEPAASAPAGDHDAAAAAAGETVLIVQLRRDTPLIAARATVLRTRLEGVGPILATEPDPGAAEFSGELRFRFGAGTDLERLRSLLESDGDIARFHFARAPQPGAAAPAPSTRVELSRLDELAEGVAQLAQLHGRLRSLIGDEGPLADVVDRAVTEMDRLNETVLALRMVPLREAFAPLPRIARDAARRLDRRVELRLEGEDVGLDRAIVEALADPLAHLLRNAVDHGIEAPQERSAAGKPEVGRIEVSAERERSRVTIRVRDDGRGVPVEQVRERATALGLIGHSAGELDGDELLGILSRSGFSTADQVSQISGRGVGLDIVAEGIRSLGGSVGMHSTPGAGTTFTLHVPLTLAVAQALRVRVGAEDYLIPVTHVLEVVEIEADSLVSRGAGEALRLRGEVVPLVRIGALLDTPGRGSGAAAVIASVGSRRGALVVDELIGRSQITLQSFEPPVGTLRLFAGATLLPDGRAALILDPASVLRGE